jgi:hypothetical protein
VDKVNPVEVQKFISGVDYPCSKQDLIDIARQNGADDDVIQTLQSLDMQHFDSPNDVSQAIGDLE